MDTILIKISEEYTKTPGVRYRENGSYSGQEFREDFLEEYFQNKEYKDLKIIVDLDDVEGYTTSFLEETFGGLVRKYGLNAVKSRLIIQAEELSYFKTLSEKYIEDAEESTEG